jgi:hypothetical protein
MAGPQITQLRVAPTPDRTRVRVQIEVSEPGEPPPFLQFTVLDPDGTPCAEMLVMGVYETLVEMTLHMRPPADSAETRPFTVRARLFYGEEGKDEQTFALREGSFRFP